MKTAVEVRGLGKSFQAPIQQAPTLRERFATHRFRTSTRVVPVLESVSFDVLAGQFFGVVGRNGSGKSTLLRLLAGIYRADSGTIRANGRIAPIIELGSGFNPDLTAPGNVVLNGVTLGLTEREARKKTAAIIEFAGLDEFTNLKLRNYSSGMKARLAFSVLVHVDCDIMLIDEVLAVGDGAFKSKSEATLRDLNNAGRTIILVTHAMSTITSFCNQALLLEGGKVDTCGGPDEVAKRYDELMTKSTDAGRGVRK